jgi:hypothetical protein
METKGSIDQFEIFLLYMHWTALFTRLFSKFNSFFIKTVNNLIDTVEEGKNIEKSQFFSNQTHESRVLCERFF